MFSVVLKAAVWLVCENGTSSHNFVFGGFRAPLGALSVTTMRHMMRFTGGDAAFLRF